LCLFLSITLLDEVTAALIPAYGADCPVAIVHKASCPDQKIVTGTLADIKARAKAAGLRTQSIIFVGRALSATDFAESRLYADDFSHRFRKARKRPAPNAKPGDPS
jgi:precorrin-4/cobalt-precorrin-4 C11-methyltransferase